MKAEKSFLGTGWAFPPTFIKATRSPVMLSDADDIRSSLEILLSTNRGDRMLRPAFGCNLRDLTFETMDSAVEAQLADMIRSSILYHEPRISPETITIDQVTPEGIAHINIRYTILATNSSQNLVYPFYLQGESQP